MDAYSVLSALRKTNMGRLTYKRDFDIADLERLSISDAPPSKGGFGFFDDAFESPPPPEATSPPTRLPDLSGIEKEAGSTPPENRTTERTSLSKSKDINSETFVVSSPTSPKSPTTLPPVSPSSPTSPTSPSSPKSPPVFSKRESAALRAIDDYETRMLEKSRRSLRSLRHKVEEATSRCSAEAEASYVKKKRELDEKMTREYNELQNKSYASMQETRRTIQDKLATDAKHKNAVQARLRQVERRRLEMEEKWAEERRGVVGAAAELETRFAAFESDFNVALDGCRFPELLKRRVGGRLEEFRALARGLRHAFDAQLAEVSAAADAAESRALPPAAFVGLARCREMTETMGKVMALVAAEVEAVEVEGEREEREKREREEKKAKEEDEKKRREEEEKERRKKEEEKKKAESVAAAAAAAASVLAVPGAAAPAPTESSRGALMYDFSRKTLAEFESLYANFAADKQQATKKLKFDLQKIVNTCVNSLANDPTEHVHRGSNERCHCPSIQTVTRLRKLVDLHEGRRVDAGAGGAVVSVADHPEAKAFVTDLTAKKIVLQSSEVVASNKEHAFPVAAVAVALWTRSDAFGRLLLARFHDACVFTVPHYPARREGQSETDHLKSLGYKVIDDRFEKQDDFLSRMSGVVRLFATVCLTQPPPTGYFADNGGSGGGVGVFGAGARPFGAGAAPDAPPATHPFGLPAAWNWLIAHLRIEPVSDITATLLYEFLVVVGNALLRVYTKQFTKVIVVLIKSYLPRIEAVTLEGRAGPVTRLKEFLQTSVMRGGVDPPEGQLPDRFWSPAMQR